MNNRAFGGSARWAARPWGTPWFFLLFLTAVFFFVEHDWYFSLSGAEGFLTSLNDLTDSIDRGNLPRRIAFLCLAVFAAACVLRPKLRRFYVDGSLGWLILFFLFWAFLSLAWAEDHALAARRLAVLATVSLGALVVSRRFSPHDTTLWVLLGTLVYLNLGIAAEIALGTFHPLSGEYRFAGTMHPNAQGMNCAFLFIAAVFMVTRQKRSRYVLYAVAAEALIFLILTKSRTSFVLGLSAPLLCRFLASTSSRKRAAVIGTVSIACLLTLLGDLVLPTVQQGILLGRGSEEADTLTGRVPVWQQAFDYIAERPVWGYGYDSFWTVDHMTDFWREQRWAVPNAHSAYIECTLGLGVVGAIVFLLIIIIAIRRALAAYRLSGNAGHGFFGSVLIFAALNGLLESAFIQPSHVTFVCMIVLAGLGFPRSPATREVHGTSGKDTRPRNRWITRRAGTTPRADAISGVVRKG